MKLILRQKLWLTFIVLANLALWVIPSNVVEQIARDRHTMLGRYSRTHFTWNLAVLALSVVSLYIDSAVGAAYRRRWFQVIAVVITLVPGLILVDAILRSRQRVYYVKDTLAYHRVPNEVLRATFVDQPEATRTYPNAPPGYPPIEGTLRTNAQGFRNAADSDVYDYDIVTLGDSFTEGSGVSDEHPWPVRLAAQTQRSVYNLGMSGYDPLNYLESLRQYGLPRHPRVVLCMIYEGNDFRSAKSDAERADGDWLTRFSTYWKQSPIIGPLDSAMIRTFGSMRISAPVNGAEVLDWLPLAVPPGPEGRRYAFSPKQLADLYRPAAEFAANRKWQNTRRILEETKALCDRAPCHLVIIYAPTKAHVVLPWVTSAGNERDSAAGLASQRPPTPEKVRAFLALGEDEENLPEASQLAADLMHHADGRESTVADWCHKASVPFISMTPPLREACAEGKQVYFTYDQHWTPIGHEVAAAAIAVRLKDLLANADSAAGSRSP